jgi:hypothetical protein
MEKLHLERQTVTSGTSKKGQFLKKRLHLERQKKVTALTHVTVME